MENLLYFAYGSNMSTRRLRHRVPSARPVGAGSLAGHRLAWHKKGADGSGKCDIPAARPGDIVYGVLYQIDAAHRIHLDRAEGLGRGYELKDVEVLVLDRAEPVGAFTYCATRTDSNYLPYAWYKDHVLIGAREHDLPADYIRLIENVPVFEDPDRHREHSERRLYQPD